MALLLLAKSLFTLVIILYRHTEKIRFVISVIQWSTHFLKILQSNTVARKDLTHPGQDVREESELLFLLGSLKYRNIIELLGSYTQNGITSLFFPLADMDLEQFLLASYRPNEFDRSTTYFRALQELRSGLAYLHQFKPRLQDGHGIDPVYSHCYHHDIKPRNILVIGTTFVLSDFGSSRLKKAGESTKTLWKNTTSEYGAPECRDPVSFAAGKVGRALDIWSIGCIISEAITHMERGREGIIEFRESRILEGEYVKSRCFHDGEKMSQNIDNFLNLIEEQASRTASSEALLVVRKTLSEHPSTRPEAVAVEHQLMHLSLREYLDVLVKLIDDWAEGTPNLSKSSIPSTPTAREGSTSLLGCQFRSTSHVWPSKGVRCTNHRIVPRIVCHPGGSCGRIRG